MFRSSEAVSSREGVMNPTGSDIVARTSRTPKGHMMRTYSVATALGLILATATLTSCGLVPTSGGQRATPAAIAVPTTTTTTTPTTTTPAPPPPANVIIVPPAVQAPPSVVTQYQYPPVYGYPYGYPYGASPQYSSGSDADFLARLRVRDIVTPGDAIETAGGKQLCSNLGDGSNITTEANALRGSPYYYSNALAGYFAGEAIKVYCPRFSYQLKPN